MMDDLAHTFQLPQRSLQDLQKIATAGMRGMVAGELRPFDKLKVNDLREELKARHILCGDRKKEELDKGVQRVPTLLLLNPKGSLQDLHLEKYCVLDCEPLHDLKGHLINLCKELPYLLQGDARKAIEEIISATVSDKMTCADHRVVLMQLYLHLRQQAIPDSILLLLETAVQIARCFYIPADSRTLCQILWLYNCTWVHNELCCELFLTFHAGMTREKMFGTYLHAIVAHASVQFEIVPLSSVNTESQERIFSQARKTATTTSNRHPQNVVSTLALRLQAKTQLKPIAHVVSQSESKVAKLSKSIPIKLMHSVLINCQGVAIAAKRQAC